MKNYVLRCFILLVVLLLTNLAGSAQADYQEGLSPSRALSSWNGVSSNQTSKGTIQGTVFDSMTNAPLDNILVQFYTADNDAYVDLDRTDSNGRYTAWLNSGRYKIYYTADHHESAYHTNKATMDEADLVEVRQNENTDIQSTLKPLPGGKVTDAETGEPIIDVAVQMFTTEHQLFGRERLTDQNGRYSLPNVPSGTYFLHFEPSDYIRYRQYHAQYFSNQSSIAEANAITIDASAPQTDLNIALAPVKFGSIRGQVTDRDTGMPVANIDVTAQERYGELSEITRTDEEGYYTLSDLHIGSYWLKFGPPAYSDSAYFTYHYPTEVLVLESTTTATIDAALEQGGRITGQVTSSINGEAIEGASVTVYDTDWQKITEAYVDATGTYTTTALPSGEYLIETNQRNPYSLTVYNDKKSLADVDVVIVNAPQIVSGVDLSLDIHDQVVISGTVRSAETNLLLDEVRIVVYDEEDQEVAYTKTTNGEYSVRGLPADNYKIRYHYESDTAYSNIYYPLATELASATTIAVNPATDVQKIDMALPNMGAKKAIIQGRATDASNGQPLSNLRVWLYDPLMNIIVGSAITDETGFYTLHGISGNRYRLRFHPDFNNRALGIYANRYSGNQRKLAEAAIISPTLANTTTVNMALPIGAEITVNMVDAETDQPIDESYGRISLRIYDDDGEQVYPAYGGSDDGQRRFIGLQTGAYRFQVLGNETQYISTYFGGTNLESATPINLQEGELDNSLTIPVKRGARVFGRVIFEESDVAYSGRVLVFNADTGQKVAEGEVDYSSFNMVGLSAGHYLFYYQPEQSATHIPFVMRAGPQSVTISETDTEVFVRIFVPKSSSQIMGRVTDEATQQPLKDIEVTLGESSIGFRTTSTDQYGRYHIRYLPVGNYPIRFKPSAWPRRNQPAYFPSPTTLAILTTPQIIKDQTLVSGYNNLLTGIVTNADTGKPVRSTVVVYLRSSDNETVFSTNPDSAGVFRFTNVPTGENRLEVRFRAGSTEPQLLQMPEGGKVTGLNIMLSTPRGARVAGRVTDAENGEPLKGISVRIFSDENDSVFGATTGGDGRYSSQPVPEGTYKIQFLPRAGSQMDTFAASYFDDTIYLAESKPITIDDAGPVTDINASLTRGTRVSGTIVNMEGKPYDFTCQGGVESNGFVLGPFALKLLDKEGNIAANGLIDSNSSKFISTALLAGSYRLLVTSNPRHIDHDNCALAEEPHHFYGNTTNIENAALIAVNGVEPIVDIEVMIDVATKVVPTPVVPLMPTLSPTATPTTVASPTPLGALATPFVTSTSTPPLMTNMTDTVYVPLVNQESQ